MQMTVKSPVYNKAVQITEEYLGPAGERFLRRQIETHLKIEPEQLQKQNIPKLLDWTTIAFALLTSDEADIDGYRKELGELARNGH